MKAMILAAGVGSRLAPITDQLPKPLIPVLGKPVLARILDLLRSAGFNEFIANTHYLGSKIHAAFADQIQIRHEETLSGVAGGIRVCKEFLQRDQQTIAIIMGDALTNIDLVSMLRAHKSSGAMVTMAVQQVTDTSQFGVVCFDEQNRVTSFQEKPKASEALSNWANTGVYLFEPEVLDFIPSEEEVAVYDVAGDLFPALLENGKHLNTFTTNSYWADLGTHDQYRQTLFDCLNGIVDLEIDGQKYSWGYLGEDSQMSAGCFVKGKAYIGKNCKLGQCILKGNVIIEDNCVIEDGVELEDCLILAGSVIARGSVVKNQNIIPTQEEEIIYENENLSTELFNLYQRASQKAGSSASSSIQVD
jgi:mannose-1-phosphate guanylyltransferase